MALPCKYSAASPALVLLVAYKYNSNPEVNFKFVASKNLPAGTPAELIFPASGEVLRGDHVIARFIARSQPDLALYGGADAFAASQIDHYLNVARLIASADKDVTALLAGVDKRLGHAAFLVGSHVTLADIGVWAAIRLKRPSPATDALHHVTKWQATLDALPEFASVKEQIPTEESQQKHDKSSGKYPPLPNAVNGKVCTRFPPEPSGFLHIGHAKAALMNEHYAREHQGTLILRFDDTNPAKAKTDFMDSIKGDLAALGIKFDKITYSSDSFEKMEKYAEQLLKDGKAYIDTANKEQIKQWRSEKKPSPARDQTVEKNMELWKEMKDGTEIGVKCVFRAKIDPANDNGVLRDPNLYRCVLTPHYRVGTKFKVYPTYDFVCPILDSIEGVTHALRSNEYHDRNALYHWVLNACNVPAVHISDFSRLNFGFTLLSKRKLQWFVDKGIVSAWDDPSFPTIQGLCRRGLTMEALREFVKSQGASDRVVQMEIDTLWSLNKRIIDPKVPRYTAVVKANAVPLTLTNAPSGIVVKNHPKHRKSPALGDKPVMYAPTVLLEQVDAAQIKENEEITLMYWGNVIVRSIVKTGDVVTSLTGELHLEGDFKSTKLKLTWLPKVDLVDVTLLHIGNLITKESLQKTDDLNVFANRNIKKENPAFGDLNLKLLKRGDQLQLERKGYYIVDVAYQAPSQPVVLIHTPDGSKGDSEHL